MKRANRLIAERSPYLLQHAYNPVDWYPWGEEAFEKAFKENKPIFLSIGYSACHWCFVMERESFEDKDVAELLNDSFISIKVDREERPDIDALYMKACQLLSGSGGWPLTVMMTPDKRPFFASTYIPKNNSFGRAGLIEILPRVRDMWATRRDDIVKSASDIVSTVDQNSCPAPAAALDERDLDLAFEHLKQTFDERHGGFGGAPKFPSPHTLMFLFRYYKRRKDAEALSMAMRTLDAMRMGGIHDHLGGGFHRYSTDTRWRVPHFEKMLYDQALIAMAYTEAWQITGKDALKRTAKRTLGYAMNELRAPDGGFFSAEGADNRDGEGAFYAWTEKDLRRELSQEQMDLLSLIFELNREEGAPSILCMKKPIEDVAVKRSIDPELFISDVDQALQLLHAARNKRDRPKIDDKVLADWNGLMIAALAKAATAFNSKLYLDAAEAAAKYVLTYMRDEEGKLFHSLRDAGHPVQAFADDYAFVIWGLIELYEACLKENYLLTAIKLNEHFIEHYWNGERACFMMSSDSHDDLPVRISEAFDGAMPSANSVHIRNLLLLSRITGETTYERMAASIAQTYASQLRAAPFGFCHMLSALNCAIGPSVDVIVAGDPKSQDSQEIVDKLRKCYMPDLLVLFRDVTQTHPKIDELSSFVRQCESIDGKATAYVCKGRHCLAPITDPQEIVAALEVNE